MLLATLLLSHCSWSRKSVYYMLFAKWLLPFFLCTLSLLSSSCLMFLLPMTGFPYRFHCLFLLLLFFVLARPKMPLAFPCHNMLVSLSCCCCCYSAVCVRPLKHTFYNDFLDAAIPLLSFSHGMVIACETRCCAAHGSSGTQTSRLHTVWLSVSVLCWNFF